MTCPTCNDTGLVKRMDISGIKTVTLRCPDCKAFPKTYHARREEVAKRVAAERVLFPPMPTGGFGSCMWCAKWFKEDELDAHEDECM